MGVNKEVEVDTEVVEVDRMGEVVEVDCMGEVEVRVDRVCKESLVIGVWFGAD